jgi:hypothetical protein
MNGDTFLVDDDDDDDDCFICETHVNIHSGVKILYKFFEIEYFLIWGNKIESCNIFVRF